MNTNTQIAISTTLKQSQTLRDKLTKTRASILSHIGSLQQEIEAIQESLTVEYTSYAALFKKKACGGFECLAVVDTRDLPENTPEEWDLCLPIPKPDTMPDFQGW